MKPPVLKSYICHCIISIYRACYGLSILHVHVTVCTPHLVLIVPTPQYDAGVTPEAPHSVYHLLIHIVQEILYRSHRNIRISHDEKCMYCTKHGHAGARQASNPWTVAVSSLLALIGREYA